MAEENPGNTPAAEQKPAAPAGGGQTPSQSGQQPAGQQGKEDEKVTLSKKEHDELQRKAAQTSEAQQRADTLQNMLDRKGKRKIEDTSPNFETKDVLVAVTSLNAKILQKAEYQKLVAGNPLLAKILSSRPWELLDTDEFADPDDLVSQVLDKLDEMTLATIGKKDEKPAAPSATEEKKEDQPAPQPAAANPGGSGSPTSENKNQPKRGGLQTATDRVADSLLGRIKIK